MIIVARIGAIEMCLDDEQAGVNHTPEQVEEIAHRLGRQAAEVYNMLPSPVDADTEGDE